jgi:hypothetical protein
MAEAKKKEEIQEEPQEETQAELELDVQVQEEPEEKTTEKTEKKPEETTVGENEEDEHAEYSVGVKKRIDKLTFKMREAERREQAAVDFAKKVKEENDSLRKKHEESSKNLFSEYENRVTLQLREAKEALKKAYETGDSEALAESQALVARLAVEEETIKREGKKQEQPKEAPVQTTSQPANVSSNPPAPPDPKAQAWARQNNWFGKDEPMTFTAFSIHRRMVEQEGYDPTSDEYYAEVDKRIREEFPHKFKEEGLNSGTTKRVAQTVAPATRAVKTGRKTVKLTKGQVDMAKRLGVPLEDYAKYVKQENV